jgi:DNA-binding CsgD family transcriptional regulator
MARLVHCRLARGDITLSGRGRPQLGVGLMVTTAQRVSPWVVFTGDLLRAPCTGFPEADIRDQFFGTFDAEPSWNHVDRDGKVAFAPMHPVDGWPTPEWQENWQRERLHRHPLHRWYAATGSPTPQSRARVPSPIAAHADHDSVREDMAALGFDQQLSIPYHLSPEGLRMFVLARADRDFSDDDMDLARRVQPLIWLVDRQVSVLTATVTAAPTPGLTGRELAVLGLLSQGRTAAAIGRRLGCSPRTVHKHLEHLYRKLEVCDRLMAVQRGRDLGLLAAPTAARR